jgi:hypothetical protein
MFLADRLQESPRYLCWVGKYDEAHRVLKLIHRDRNDPTDAVAEAEFTQIKAQVLFDKAEEPSYIKVECHPLS